MSSNRVINNLPNNQETINTTTDLLTDFHKILELFDRENLIYKNQINILKDAVTTLQTNDDNLISNMSRELQELRSVINNIHVDPASNLSTSTITGLNQPRDISDYLCQICLDKPRDCLLEPCMHFCICTGCVRKLSDKNCPICRRDIDFWQNVFIS